MPRQSRVDAPGALHHVMVRGIDGKKIFTDRKDYSAFLDRLGDLLIETRTSCYAWALIPNHFHLLLRCDLLNFYHNFCQIIHHKIWGKFGCFPKLKRSFGEELA